MEEQSQFHVLYTWKYNPRWTISLLLRERERRAIRAASPFTIDRNYIVPWFPHHCPSKTCWKKSRNIPTLSFKGSGKATRHEAPPLVVSRLTLVGWLVGVPVGGMDCWSPRLASLLLPSSRLFGLSQTPSPRRRFNSLWVAPSPDPELLRVWSLRFEPSKDVPHEFMSCRHLNTVRG